MRYAGEKTSEPAAHTKFLEGRTKPVHQECSSARPACPACPPPQRHRVQEKKQNIRLMETEKAGLLFSVGENRARTAELEGQTYDLRGKLAELESEKKSLEARLEKAAGGQDVSRKEVADITTKWEVRFVLQRKP